MVEPGGKQHTVLIVDDEDMVLTLGRVILERRGYRVLVALSGAAAIQTCRELDSPPDCIIVDYTMSEMNGRETLQEIRKIVPGIPALVSSGYSDEEIFEEMNGVEVCGTIHKPYRQESLVASLEKALALREERSAQRGQIIR